MAIEYLRGLCQRNQFADGGFEVCGARLQLSDIGVPVCAVACETDHIAAWAQSYRGVQQMTGADRHFILAESGHVAGIINPPQRNKYGFILKSHWPRAQKIGDLRPLTPQEVGGLPGRSG